MSGFTLNAYRQTYGFQGSGIYSDTNTFSLNGNTVILFAFCLGLAFIISAAYFFLARIFTKVAQSSILLMVAIHLDHGYSTLYSRFRHCNRLFHSKILFRRYCIPHFRRILYHLFLLLATAYSIRNANSAVYNGHYEEISFHRRHESSWTYCCRRFWRMVECQSG